MFIHRSLDSIHFDFGVAHMWPKSMLNNNVFFFFKKRDKNGIKSFFFYSLVAKVLEIPMQIVPSLSMWLLRIAFLKMSPNIFACIKSAIICQVQCTIEQNSNHNRWWQTLDAVHFVPLMSNRYALKVPLVWVLIQQKIEKTRCVVHIEAYEMRMNEMEEKQILNKRKFNLRFDPMKGTKKKFILTNNASFIVFSFVYFKSFVL